MTELLAQSVDPTQPRAALRCDVDPVRMMRPQFADSIRASSRFGLHQQAHMTATDLSAARAANYVLALPQRK